MTDPPTTLVARAKGVGHRYDGGAPSPRKGGGGGRGAGRGAGRGGGRDRAGGRGFRDPSERATDPGAAALRGIDIELEAGTLTALLGANGSGKSTLARILAGRLSPSEGRISLLGVDAPASATPPIRRRLRRSVVHLDQDLALDPEMTGAETLELLATLEGLPTQHRRARIEELVEAFRLEEPLGRAVAKSSGGQRRRLHLAAALLGDPKLLVVDEPSAGLDAEGRRRLWALLRKRVEGGTAVLIISHDLERIEEYADRAVLLHQGRQVADGPASEVVRAAEENESTRVGKVSSVPAPTASAAMAQLPMASGRGPGLWLASVRALCQRTFEKTLRRPVVLTFSLVQPLVWMSFFGFLFQRFDLGTGNEVRYLDFLVPGVCAMTVLFGASQSGISWIRDLHTGFLPRLLGTPASPLAILGGKILADILRLGAQSAAVLALAVVLGARIHFGTSLIPAVVGLLLFATAFSSLSCAIALRTRAQEAMAAFVHVVNMPMLFTSTALVPRRQMPEWLSELARFNPLSHAVDGLRHAMLDGASPATASLLLLALVAAILFALAAREMGRLQTDPG